MACDWTNHLHDLAKARPQHADVWCTLGQALHIGGELQDARSALDRAVDLNPNYVDALVARSFVTGDLGAARDGYAQLRPLFGLAPDDHGVVFAIGVYCMRHGWHETGLAQLQRAASLNPQAAFPALFLAAALEQLGRREDAEHERAHAAELMDCICEESGLPRRQPRFAPPEFFGSWPAPGLARAQVQRAMYLMQTGRDDAAAEELELAHARFPGDSRVMVETGRLLLVRDRSADAQRWFEAAIAVDAHNHKAHVEQSYLHAAKGSLDHARDALRRAVELRPMFPDYRYQYGMVLTDLGRIDDAIGQFEQALILNGGHGDSALQLASAYAMTARDDDALALLSAGPWRTWPETQLLSAELLARNGDPSAARTLLSGVLTQMPGHPAAIELLAGLDA